MQISVDITACRFVSTEDFNKGHSTFILLQSDRSLCNWFSIRFIIRVKIGDMILHTNYS